MDACEDQHTASFYRTVKYCHMLHPAIGLCGCKLLPWTDADYIVPPPRGRASTGDGSSIKGRGSTKKAKSKQAAAASRDEAQGPPGAAPADSAAVLDGQLRLQPADEPDVTAYPTAASHAAGTVPAVASSASELSASAKLHTQGLQEAAEPCATGSGTNT